MPTKEGTKKTPKQKGIKFLKVLLTVVIIIAVIAAFIAAANLVCLKSSENFISSIKTVDTDGLTPNSTATDITPLQQIRILRLCNLPMCISVQAF